MTAIADAHQAIAALGWSRLAGRDFPPQTNRACEHPQSSERRVLPGVWTRSGTRMARVTRCIER